MTIPVPEFGPCNHYIDEMIAVPCLCGTARNSTVPGLAELVRSKSGEDAELTIFLRSVSPSTVTPWQQEMLDRLLTKAELIAVIEHCFADYKKDLDEESLNLHEDFWADVQSHRLLRHLELRKIAVDDIERKVLLEISTGAEGHLDEHGVCLVFEVGDWRFETGDYLTDYTQRIESASRMATWNQIFPPPTAQTPINTDANWVYGTWAFDEIGTRRLAARLGSSPAAIQVVLEGFADWEVEISPQVFRLRSSPSNAFEGTLLGVCKQGNRVTFKHNFSSVANVEGTMEFVFEEGLLKNSDGLALKRTKIFQPAPTNVPEPTAGGLNGRWELDPDQTAALLRHRGASETRIKIELQQKAGLVIEFARNHYTLLMPDGRGGKRPFKLPLGKVVRNGSSLVLQGGEKYFHQDNLLATVNPGLVAVLRKTGSKETTAIDCIGVCALFKDVQTKPGI